MCFHEAPPSGMSIIGHYWFATCRFAYVAIYQFLGFSGILHTLEILASNYVLHKACSELMQIIDVQSIGKQIQTQSIIVR